MSGTLGTGASISHAKPRKGYVLSTAVEEIASPTRKAAAALQKCPIDPTLRRALDCTPDEANPFFTDAETWKLLGICLVVPKNLVKNKPESWIKWFYRENFTNLGPASGILSEFAETVVSDTKATDLLPYIFDAHGPGTRLSVRKEPGTAKARAHKKAGGIFYTPVDVADFMINAVLKAPIGREPPTLLDPAVGTGVFLRSALAYLTHIYLSQSGYDLATKYLFGADKDPFALNGAAFVLLHDTLASIPPDVSPSQAWQRIRENLVQVDSLLLDQENGSLSRYFPRLQGGADVVVGNPPYASIGMRSDFMDLTARFQTLAAHPKTTADLYPIFVEQMIRLGRPDGSGAMVVPLSLASNTGGQFQACRELLDKTPGQWRLAFFDREPHALFGEDVKTRNSIVFRNKASRDEHRLFSGPLRRWRGSDRDEMLATIGFTDIGRLPIVSGIPKVDGKVQADALQMLKGVRTLSSIVMNSGKTELSRLPNAHRAEVLIGPTAYNFLNIARATMLPLSRGEQLSENALHRLMFRDEATALAVFALLTTDFAFWWWYVNGDGFHVNASHLLTLPIGEASEEALEQLSLLGRQLWSEARKTPNRSSNRGRVTFSFPARSFISLRNEIQKVQYKVLGMNSEFAASVAAFVSTVVDARLFPRQNENN